MVVETSASGHRLVYVHEIIAKALQLDMSVVLAAADEVLTDPRRLGILARCKVHSGWLRSRAGLVSGNCGTWRRAPGAIWFWYPTRQVRIVFAARPYPTLTQSPPTDNE